ncbi:MAG: tagaturonate reductase [Candidatus Helarchaeota archaeon]
MQLLTRKFLKNYQPSVPIILPHDHFFDLPVKILQFGEGRFIRAFLNYFMEVANHKQIFNGRSIIIQPRKADKAQLINAQDGLFTLCSRGLRNGVQYQKFMIISSIKEAIAAKIDWNTILTIAELPTIQIIASNTTEAGLIYDPTDKMDSSPPTSFPGKLTALLYHRYQFFDGAKDKGLFILPLELIENNGTLLKKLIIQVSQQWNLGKSFLRWLNEANSFYNCIVDRIVTGFPKQEELTHFQSQLNYEDKFFNIAELYHSWIIEGDQKLRTVIPFDQAGLNVQFVSNITNYYLRKVRILNGAHTSMVPIAYLSGKNFVKESIEDPIIGTYIDAILTNEVIPFIDLPHEELLAYKKTIIERFRNPFLEHKLISISLYSCSKMKLRVLPSILAYYKKFHTPPPLLPFAFAAFLAFMNIREKSDTDWIGYRDSEPFSYQDDPDILETFYKAWRSVNPLELDHLTRLVTKICQNITLWEQDLTQLPEFVSIVAKHLYNIFKTGMLPSLQSLLRNNNLSK